ncbi:MAG: hypothetical protein M9894_24540 [Planctomycetes bacterium]|nr:hypothetical protein [Planctomycetota bacterium]
MDEELRRLERGEDTVALAAALVRAGEGLRARRMLAAAASRSPEVGAELDRLFPLSFREARGSCVALREVLDRLDRVLDRAEDLARQRSGDENDETFDELIVLIGPLRQLAIHAESACIESMWSEQALLSAAPLEARVRVAAFVRDAPDAACTKLQAPIARLAALLAVEEGDAEVGALLLSRDDVVAALWAVVDEHLGALHALWRPEQPPALRFQDDVSSDVEYLGRLRAGRGPSGSSSTGRPPSGSS